MFKRNMVASGLNSQVYTFQFNCHGQTAETLPVLTSDYTTDTVVWAVIILHDVPTKDRATCFSK